MDTKIVWLVVAFIAKMVTAGQYIDGYYFSYPLLMNWYEAQRFCAYQDMQFLDIPNDREYDKFDAALDKWRTLINGSTFHWIAGTKLGSDNGQFYWITTGHPMWYQKWGVGEPNNAAAELCIVLNTDGLFADADCKTKASFICREKYQEPVKRETTTCAGF